MAQKRTLDFRYVLVKEHGGAKDVGVCPLLQSGASFKSLCWAL